MGRTGFNTSFECIIRARDEGLAHPLWGVSVWAEIFGHIWLSLAIFTRKDLGWVGSTASLASSQPAEPGKCCTVHWMRWQHPASTASSRRLELAPLSLASWACSRIASVQTCWCSPCYAKSSPCCDPEHKPQNQNILSWKGPMRIFKCTTFVLLALGADQQ